LPSEPRICHVSARIYHATGWATCGYEHSFSSSQAYIAFGWNEWLGVLDRLDAALERMDRESDPCLATGKGWIAEEAFATALLCFLMFPDDPLAVIRRAAVTSGDSDSIACVAGSFAGSYHGVDALPAAWIERIEYRDRLMALSTSLAST
jgi:hypothetical protein